MKTAEVVAAFLADCKLRGLSAKTLEGYSYHGRQLITLSKQFPPKPSIIQVFLAEVQGPHNADAHYRTFKRIDNYAHARFKTKNFMNSVTRPRVPREIMPTISEIDLMLLAHFLRDAPLLERALMIFLVDTGVRASEAANILRKDVTQFPDRVIVKGKTGYRVAPISAIPRDLLLSLPVHEDGYIFHGRNRGKNSRPLTRSGIYRISRKYLRMIGYSGGKQFGPQTLRRSLGRFHLMDGGDHRSLQMIMGHSDPNTTFRAYIPLLTKDVIEIHHKHTPGRIFEEVK